MNQIRRKGTHIELWHGIKREEIAWYPTVDTHKCIGCELCFVTCGRQVYTINHEAKKQSYLSRINV